MPASVVQTFRGFAYNNAWAEPSPASACANLSQEEFEARRTGFFPSLQRTLNHIYVIDLFYIDALKGGRLGPKAWENTVPYQSPTELALAQASMDKRLIVVCDALMPDQLSRSCRSIAPRACRPNGETGCSCIFSSTKSTTAAPYGAALLLAVVIGAFATSGITFIKMIGVGMLVAILLDATVVRTLLVPAAMRLMGRANWWAPGAAGPVVGAARVPRGAGADRETIRQTVSQTGRILTR